MDLGSLHPSYWLSGDSVALAINDRGLVVGSSETGQFDADGDPIRRAFLFDPFLARVPPITDLNTSATLGWRLTEATVINNNGQICVNGVQPTAVLQPGARALLLSP
jgi:hypothetical protein